MKHYIQVLERRARELDAEVDASRMKHGTKLVSEGGTYSETERRKNLVRRSRASTYREVARELLERISRSSE